MVDAVVVLKSPKLEGDKLTFDVDVLEGDLAGGDGAASVFMDIINLPIAAPHVASRRLVSRHELTLTLVLTRRIARCRTLPCVQRRVFGHISITIADEMLRARFVTEE